MNRDPLAPLELHTAAPEPDVTRALDVVVCVDAPSKGVFRRVRRLLRQCADGARVIVVDGGHIDAPSWSRLQGLAREASALLLLRHHGAAGPSSVELAMAHSAGRDVVLLAEPVQVFPGFLRALARAARDDTHAGLISPLSNRSRHSVDTSWSSALPPPAGLRPKRWAKLIQRVASRSRPELVAPDSACLLVRRELLEILGPPPIYGKDGAALAQYADEARKHGFRVRLADDVYVQHPDPEPAAEGDSTAPAPNESHMLGELLVWHVRRGTAKGRTAPLLALGSSPFAEAPPDAAVVRSLLDRLRLPRAVLAYPAAGGIELAEIIDGDPQKPFIYQRDLSAPLDASLDDTREAEDAVRELLELFQIGFIHVIDVGPWARALSGVLGNGSVPYCVSVNEGALDESREPAALLPSLLGNARAVLCSSEAACADLCRRFPIKAKRLHAETDAPSPGGEAADDAPRLSAWTAAYDACRSRASARAGWLEREQLQRLRALYRGASPRPAPPAQVAAELGPPLVERWVQRIGRRAPGVLRSAFKRLPYPSKQQRKPR